MSGEDDGYDKFAAEAEKDLEEPAEEVVPESYKDKIERVAKKDPEAVTVFNLAIKLYSWAEIARETGLSQGHIANLRKRYKLDQLLVEHSVNEFELIARGRATLVLAAQKRLLQMMESGDLEMISYAVQKVLAPDAVPELKSLADSVFGNKAVVAKVKAISINNEHGSNVVEEDGSSIEDSLDRARALRAELMNRGKNG